MPPPRWVRIVVTTIVGAVLGSVWVLAGGMFVTGLILWRDWRALAREGVDHEARVTVCVWEVMHVKKATLPRTGSGFYSCDYRYTLGGSGPAHSGHFQSPREWKSGEAIAIRYRHDQPSVSATLKDLEHPSLTPAALMLLPLVFAGIRFRAPLLRAVGRGSRHSPS